MMALRPLRLIAFSLCPVSLLSGVQAAMWHVDGSVPQSGDGFSWATAFKTIQEGIDAASDGDTVTVALGTYVENIHFEGKKIVLTSTYPSNPEVVDGTIIDGSGSACVVRFAGTEDESCVLAGFTLTNGAYDRGAGICGGELATQTRARIQDNVVTGNSASSADYVGGLAYCDGEIQNNTIVANSGTGLAYCDGTIQGNRISGNSGHGLVVCDGTIRDNTIAVNSKGGLIRCNGTIQNNTITGNSTGLHGSGAGLAHCNGTIQNNTISNNSTGTFDGGGLAACNGIIQNNMITGNSGASFGGGLARCHGTIQNNMILNNSAESWNGGGLYDCNGIIQNNTITGNSAGFVGAGLFSCYGVIRNCIIWGNSDPDGRQILGSNRPTYSCIQDWTDGGPGNITAEPLFLDSSGDNYHLRPGSPCIDAGVNYYWFAWPQRDLDGNCRLQGVRVDMGCFESGSSPDADGDLLSDEEERAKGTDLNLDDTDGDGLRDGLEVLRGSELQAATPPATLEVPTSVPAIQGALCLAVNGDEVIVAPGTYYENLRFCGANVVLRCSNPANPTLVAGTIIDGAGAGPVLCLAGTETESSIISGFTIRGGSAVYGGGIFGGTEGNETHATIQYNTISENRATRYGAGLYGCDGTICNNTISGNSADSMGGGLYGCNGTIQNNTISNNSVTASNGDGGGLSECYGNIQNNTISGNSAEEVGGGLYACRGTVQNCIIWGNVAPEGAQVYLATPTHSCIQEWTGGGEGNISLDPRFVDVDGLDNDPETYEDNDYRLLGTSPCIDSGNNENWMWTAVDQDRNPRIFYGGVSLTVDMGAFEYGSWPFKIVEISEGAGGRQVIWNSRLGDLYRIQSCLDLSGNQWNDEETKASEGELTTWTDVDTTSTRKFYRIGIR